MAPQSQLDLPRLSVANNFARADGHWIFIVRIMLITKSLGLLNLLSPVIFPGVKMVKNA